MANILIIEDMQPIREAIAIGLEKEGHTVLQATDGKKGLALALAEHPDLLLIDIIMPEMNGDELVRTIREDSWGKTVPIMMLTNVGDSDQIAAVQKYDVVDYMVKSNWELDKVIANIQRKLQQTAEPAA